MARRDLEIAAAVRRKLTAAGLPGDDGAAGEEYATALAEWQAELAAASFGAVVCDYDGTVCPVGSGHDPPPALVQTALGRLLAAGYLVGFASGRGRSLHRELRGWVPRAHWDRVLVGMYTGGARVWLTDDISADEELPRPDVLPAAAAALAEAHDRLAALPFDRLFTLDRRLGQVSIKPHPWRPAPMTALAAVAAAVVGRPPALPVRLAASSHAVDVVPTTVHKAAVVAELAAAVPAGSAVLAVGDRGEPGGNDYELLACTPYSLSVDRCSADPTRCWNVAAEDEVGPPALVRYLTALLPRS